MCNTDGFPLDENGIQICAKCNTNVGCSRPLLDNHNIDLRRQLFEVEELHQPHKLLIWYQNAMKYQRCIWGVHKPITTYQSRQYQEWFDRLDNEGFQPYDNNQLLYILKDFLIYIHEIAYDMQLHKDEYTTDDFNEQSLKVIKLSSLYKELSGESFQFEVLCTRDNEICNQRRASEGGVNHTHIGEYIICIIAIIARTT